MDLQTFYEETGFTKTRTTTVRSFDDEFSPTTSPSNRDWIRLEFDQLQVSPQDQVLPELNFDLSSVENEFGSGLDWNQTNTSDGSANWSVVEETPLEDQELALAGEVGKEQNLLDISQNYFDLWYGSETPASTTATKKAKVADYPTYFDDSSSESDFDFEEGEDFVLINFHRKKKSSKAFARKTLSFDDDEGSFGSPMTKSTPKQTKIIDAGNSTIIKLNEEKLNKATQYFNIDINDIKKYYTNKGECLLCGNIYFSSATAKRHIKLSHMKLREFSCPQCFLNFQEHKGVKEHLRRFHPEYEIVDLRTVKKEFRKSIVGGYIQDRVNPEIFEEKPFKEKVEKLRKSHGKKKKKKGSKKNRRETILLSCEYCDEKFKHTSSIRSHISRFHTNPETPASSRQRNKSTASTSQRRRKTSSFTPGQLALIPSKPMIKIEPEDDQENRALRRERRHRRLDAQRDLLQSLLTELNEDENVSKLLSGKKIKTEPNYDELESSVDTDGFIGLQQQPILDTNSAAKTYDDDIDICNIVHQLSVEKTSNVGCMMNCPKCQIPIMDIPEFNSHMLHHWKESKACAVCSSPKNSKQSLLVHVRIHSGEKPFECLKCKAGFKQQSQADHHQKRCKVVAPINDSDNSPGRIPVSPSGAFTSLADQSFNHGAISSQISLPRKLSKHGKPLGRPRKIK